MTDGTETTPDRLFLPPSNQRRHVRWDPTINTGHLLSAGTSIIASLVFVMASWASMDKRVVVLEEARVAQREREAERAEQLKGKIDDVKDAIRETKDSVESLRREIQNSKGK